MATLSFEGDTSEEITEKVRRWLRSVDSPDGHLEATEAVERLSGLVKDGLSVVAKAAPDPVAHSDVTRGLSEMGYRLTDETAHAVVSGLNALAELSGDRLVARVRSAGRTAAFDMQSAVAREVLHALRRR